MRFPLSLLAGLAVSGGWFGIPAGLAQNLVPNPGFESGETAPTGWRLADGAGEWMPLAGTPNHVVCVRGTGDDQSVWRTDPLPLQPGGLYALRFRGRRVGDASGGTAVAGTSRINRDFPMDAGWREYRFVFRQPDDAPNDFVRLGQWHVKGAVEFDDAELLPVLASHQSVNGSGTDAFRAGAGEQVETGSYRFAPDLGWAGANFHQPVVRATAAFNSDRWVFSPGSEVVYHFHLPGQAQTSGRLAVAINHHVAGVLAIEASRDGRAWTRVAGLDEARRAGTVEMPAALLPATNLLVRLWTPEANTSLQVNRCDYEARLAGEPLPATKGRTDFLEVLRRDPRVTVERFVLCPARGQGMLQVDVAGTLNFTTRVELEHELSGPTVQPTAGSKSAFTHRPGAQQFATSPTVQARVPGEHELRFALRAGPAETVLEARTVARLSHLDDPRAGRRLAGANGLVLWWAESGWKISRASQPPETSGAVKPVSLALARGEFEAAQVLIRPETEQELLSATVSELNRPGGTPRGITGRLNELAYVPITRVTDSRGEPGWHPDPLPPLIVPRKLPPHDNLALWLTLFASRETAPGDYSGELRLRFKSGAAETTVTVPLVVHVYDFDLPRESHLRSAFGLGAGAINQYHHLTRRADQVAVFEQYLQNFAEHRISPYSFYDYAPIQLRFEGEGTNKQARVDFTAFDAAAARWLGPGGFNTFQLPLRGMGGGTFHSRHPGELEGFPEGTPEHARLFGDYLGQVERHLREKGWLDKAFTYWFDEPDPKDYAFVVAGQQRIKAAAPGLRRMMTEQPEPELMGHVDIWCGLTPEWTPEKVRARRAAGEEVWWYLCTAPKAPHLGLFIDHPGTALRLWPWQSWQYGVTGVLVWATTYWHSPEAYPDSLQNPWQDPMSWVTSYGTPKGTRSPWGNGDGRFLYPPRRDPNAATEPNLDGPISSIRWENLRDGMEDYEYFWLLDQEIIRVAALKSRTVNGDGRTRDELLTEANALLVVPENVSKDLTHFTDDPRLMLAHREKIARMIERLKRVN